MIEKYIKYLKIYQENKLKEYFDINNKFIIAISILKFKNYSVI